MGFSGMMKRLAKAVVEIPETHKTSPTKIDTLKKVGPPGRPGPRPPKVLGKNIMPRSTPVIKENAKKPPPIKQTS
jgi:hypothetical protein